MRPFIIFVHNYSANFIQEIWGQDPMMAQHLQSKFDGYAQYFKEDGMSFYQREGLMMKFLAELSSDKLKDVEKHIEENPQMYG